MKRKGVLGVGMYSSALICATLATMALDGAVPGLSLDPSRGHSLGALSVNGVDLVRTSDAANEFPTFTCLDLDNGRFKIAGSDSRWHVERQDDTVIYSSTNGLSVSVAYSLTKKGASRIVAMSFCEPRS